MFRIILPLLLALCGYAQQLASTTGEQRTIAVPVTFSDTPATCPFTAEHLRTTVFGQQDSLQLNGFYRTVTNGRVWLTGDATECVTLPTSYYTCGGTALPDVNTAVERVLATRGYNMDLYNRRILAMSAFPCPWAGLGSFGAGNTTPGGTQYSVLWVKCGYNPYSPTAPVSCPLAHEFGHNLGMAHAWCQNVADEYCDNTDTMGRCSACGFNSAHWIQMGWTQPQTVNGSGTFTIGTLEDTGNALLVGDKYYVAYRKNLGHAYIHAKSTRFETLLVDATPETSYTVDSQLLGGRTFSDGSLYITLLEKTTSTATFSIQFGGGSVPPPPPPPPPSTTAPLITPSSAVVPWHTSIMFTSDQPVTWTMSGYGSIVSPLPRSVIYSASGNPKGGTARVFAANPAGQITTITIFVPKR
jgi:hypothetical protein